MTDQSPQGTTPAAPGELRSALANLIEAIDEAEGAGETGELRHLAEQQLAGIDRRAAAGSAPGGDDDDHDGPIDALRDALHQFETEHPALTSAVNDVSHFLSGMGI